MSETASNPKNFPYRAPFTAACLMNWVQTEKPTLVGMNDSQYAWFTGTIAGMCLKNVEGVPIHFIGAPKV